MDEPCACRSVSDHIGVCTGAADLVTALGNGLYKVNFIDMGIKGNRTLKIIDVNGTLKFDAIK